MKPGSVYEKLGLHTGDVIRGVNGEQINSLSDALKLYARLRSGDAAGPVTVEVSRAGRTETLQYHLQ
jgi:general secretion pathway protein C